MKKLILHLKNYALKTEGYSIPRIIIEFVLLDIALTLLIQITASLFLTLFIVFPLLLINPKIDINQLLGFLNFNQDIIKQATSQTPMATFATIFAVIMAPLMETAIFQVLPIWLLSFLTKRRHILVLTSALLFALAHVYPLLILYIFPGGVILAWTFVMLKKRVGGWKAFFVTALIHGLFNLANIIGAMILGY